ncbi:MULTISPECIES: type II secretion system minor pseudopilin GspH [Pseudoalteromonas]|jgi:general secretion pathway protein H|uniref:Type II secretion system protein H n=1 Tax=Pseudoalteromonas translucida (strain TAC 125) TaxID=326442 RepID=Q3ILN6_PSET1|nr:MULTISPECIES: type II secretion system minor pseudopilin GspH [Pseudoalteromonas]MBB1372295.1 type II secretion system minor pseudopilin GspH [Pseudoalteromonas sp. SR45-4]MBB1407281.1 type II secretion system minor pseudopilin GspH [Pseudoalteromonas sp. SG44-5]MBO7927792.1 type II secretion system minor pseudopilin GspH [Pseudoalteromonas sp. K222D]WMS94721.1 type II secretion system minor pseudopilin GspH [Pseudoalteromonas sp. HL-AS2]CAI85339.1 putative general secretion pathway protein|tara:strand:+ start:10075 stop:10659 length:585 start_codon:yes stop_codon:yes gene_type:complete
MQVSSERLRAKSRGFSLIEILVVLVIIAFATKMVVYSLEGGAEDELDTQALRLHTTINMASEFAILNQVELGFHIDNNVFEFLVFDGEKWVSFVREALFEPVEFDPRFKLALNLDDLAWAQDNLLEQANWRELMSGDEDSLLELKKFKIPQVLILSSGEVSAFQLTLELKEQSEPVYFIEGEFTAPVNLRREPE